MTKEEQELFLNVTAEQLLTTYGKQEAVRILAAIRDGKYHLLDKDVLATLPPRLRNIGKQLEGISKDELHSSSSPPRGAEFLLYLFLPKQLRDSLIGDLEEEMRTRIAPKFGPRRALLWYWKQTIGALWSGFKIRIMVSAGCLTFSGRILDFFKRMSG